MSPLNQPLPLHLALSPPLSKQWRWHQSVHHHQWRWEEVQGQHLTGWPLVAIATNCACRARGDKRVGKVIEDIYTMRNQHSVANMDRAGGPEACALTNIAPITYLNSPAVCNTNNSPPTIECAPTRIALSSPRMLRMRALGINRVRRPSKQVARPSTAGLSSQYSCDQTNTGNGASPCSAVWVER